MRKFITPAIIAAVLATAGAALASEQATGTVKSWDSATHMLIFDNGISYQLPASFKANSFKKGEKVHVSYDMKDGKRMATEANIVK
ncbi:MAG: DUF1344 domain-containing protein [Acidiferrobacterales bacterium]|nr:DUF1344 domain-containing protein [Acidiferrobacterales bacterium]